MVETGLVRCGMAILGSGLRQAGAGGRAPPEAASLSTFYRESCAFYAGAVLSGPPQPPYRGRFLIAPHHESWSRAISASDRICILAPRDSGKSYFFNMAYPIWMMEKHPGQYGMIFSGSQVQAERILEAIVDEVLANDKLAHLRPSRSSSGGRAGGKGKGAWSAKRVTFGNGHTIYARGYGTMVRGSHPLWVVADDVLNDEDSYSELKRNRNIEYFRSAITNMVIPGGQIIVVGTPFHAQDLYGMLESNPEYLFQRYQSIQPDGSALWPARYPVERLARRRREIGVVQFTREFQCMPVADGMSLFPGHLFESPEVMRTDVCLGDPREAWEALGVERFIEGVDFARSAGVGADYTVVTVVGLDAQGNHWICEMRRAKGLAFPDQLSRIESVGRAYDVDAIMCESNQMQAIFGEELLRTTDLPIQNVHTGTEKHAMDQGVPALSILLENEKVRIPRGDTRSVDVTDVFIEELRGHTFVRGRVHSVGAHDDTVMSWYLAEKGVRSSRFSASFGDDIEIGHVGGGAGGGAGGGQSLAEAQSRILGMPRGAEEAGVGGSLVGTLGTSAGSAGGGGAGGGLTLAQVLAHIGGAGGGRW